MSFEIFEDIGTIVAIGEFDWKIDDWLGSEGELAKREVLDYLGFWVRGFCGVSPHF